MASTFIMAAEMIAVRFGLKIIPVHCDDNFQKKRVPRVPLEKYLNLPAISLVESFSLSSRVLLSVRIKKWSWFEYKINI